MSEAGGEAPSTTGNVAASVEFEEDCVLFSGTEISAPDSVGTP
jgi:hypothetical protein